MEPAKWRKQFGLSQGQLAHRLGLKSRGRISSLESGAEPWPTDLAIAMDRLTRGVVQVADLRPDLHDVRVIRSPNDSQVSA